MSTFVPNDAVSSFTVPNDPNDISCVIGLYSAPLPPASPDEVVVGPQTGSVVSFHGYTRGDVMASDDRNSVVGLEYSCYVPMAMKMLRSICSSVPSRCSSSFSPGAAINRISISHSIDCLVPLGHASFSVSVHSAHRKEGLVVLEWLLEEVKGKVPIWKKEVYGGGGTKWCRNKEWRKGV